MKHSSKAVHLEYFNDRAPGTGACVDCPIRGGSGDGGHPDGPLPAALPRAFCSRLLCQFRRNAAAAARRQIFAHAGAGRRPQWCFHVRLRCDATLLRTAVRPHPLSIVRRVRSRHSRCFPVEPGCREGLSDAPGDCTGRWNGSRVIPSPEHVTSGRSCKDRGADSRWPSSSRRAW